MRVLAVDLGSRRIGLAVSDPTGTLASPYEVLQRSGDEELDRRRILEAAEELEVERIVVGLPLSLDGSIGPAAEAAQEQIALLAALTPLPVEPYDERLTTVTADRLLGDRGVRSKARRKVIDKAAAAVMLQAWLDSQRSSTERSKTEGSNTERGDTGRGETDRRSP